MNIMRANFLAGYFVAGTHISLLIFDTNINKPLRFVIARDVRTKKGEYGSFDTGSFICYSKLCFICPG